MQIRISIEQSSYHCRLLLLPMLKSRIHYYYYYHHRSIYLMQRSMKRCASNEEYSIDRLIFSIVLSKRFHSVLHQDSCCGVILGVDFCIPKLLFYLIHLKQRCSSYLSSQRQLCLQQLLSCACGVLQRA